MTIVDFERNERIARETFVEHGNIPAVEALASANIELRRIQRLFDEAGHGEHNVLALLDHQIESSSRLQSQVNAVADLLENYRCDCIDCTIYLIAEIRKAIRNG